MTNKKTKELRAKLSVKSPGFYATISNSLLRFPEDLQILFPVLRL